jgi:serine/threonine protein kinase
MSPQQLNGDSYSSKCDIWALGVLFYFITMDEYPFVANSAIQLLETIKNKKLSFKT